MGGVEWGEGVLDHYSNCITGHTVMYLQNDICTPIENYSAKAKASAHLHDSSKAELLSPTLLGEL